MRRYPSIKRRERPKGITSFYAFNKLDGSNVSVGWNRKKGFHAWRRRNGLLDSSSPYLEESPNIFSEKYEDQLATVLTDKK